MAGGHFPNRLQRASRSSCVSSLVLTSLAVVAAQLIVETKINSRRHLKYQNLNPN